MNIAIDSMVVIYAGIAPPKDENLVAGFGELRERALLLFAMAAKKKDTIVLPTVAVSELLVPVPKSQQGQLIATLQRLFVCPPFDVPAASIAADLFAQHKKLARDQKCNPRHVVRADTMIIASASAAGATEFYSHDEECRAIAGIIMKAHDLPKQDPDNPLFWRQVVSEKP